MLRTNLMVGCLFLLGLLVQRRLVAQTYTCVTDSVGPAHTLYDYVVRLVTGSDSETVATRNQYKLPSTTPSKVSIVTTASVCRQAGAAYHSYVDSVGAPEISRKLVVIKVATSRYVVLDPDHRRGEYELHVVFDSKWNPLIGFAS